MQVSRSLEYAVKSLVCLASSPKPMGLKAISSREGIPLSYLAKIMRLLVEGGIVTSRMGRKGGYLLHKEPGTIRLLDAYLLTEGDSKLIPCMENGAFCSANEFCTQKPVWIKVQKAINEAFKNVTLDEMVPKEIGGGAISNERADDRLA